MESKEDKVKSLQKTITFAEEKLKSLNIELQEAHQAVAEEKFANIDKEIPYYTKKLERLKIYVDSYDNEENIRYGFKRQMSRYRYDYDFTRDALDIRIMEFSKRYDEEEPELEILFGYFATPLKDFVKKWMDEHIPKAVYVGGENKHDFSWRSKTFEGPV